MSLATSVDMDLSRLLADGALNRHSGILTAVRGKLKRLFCLDNGRLVFARSNVIEEQFSELLIREKLISVTELSAAHRASEKMGVELTRWLVDEQVLDRQTLERNLEQHLRHLLFSTLDWPDGEASLARGNADLGGQVSTSLSCISLLLEYTGKHPASLQEVQRRVGPASACLQVTEDRRSILDGTESRPAIDHLLESCDGRLSITDLVRTSPEPDEPTWRSLYGLLLIGVVASTAKAASAGEAGTTLIRKELLARIEQAGLSDHYSLLRVNPGSSREQILRAYYAVARAYHPDRFRAGPLADLRAQVESYFARVTEAYDTLYNPETRAAYDQDRAEEKETKTTQDTTDLAKENFKRAKSLIARGRLADAVPWLENAIQQDAGNAVYRVELGQVMARNPRLRSQAEQHFIEANRIDPSFVDGYFALGELYLKRGNRENAARMFREVLRWEPDHPEAGARLEKLG